jgi:hypothetical protein
MKRLDPEQNALIQSWFQKIGVTRKNGDLSKLPENPMLLNLGMNGCPEGRPFLSARRQGTMACSGHGTEDKFAN